MPYLPVDLDGKKKWPLVAKGCAVPIESVSHGFVELWQLVWQTKCDRVTPLQLECLFGAPGERAGRVLVEFGFLEEMDNAYRVRGAEAWLRVPTSRSENGRKGGQKTASNRKSLINLKQNRGGATEAPLRENTEATEAIASDAPKQTPKPFHPAPSTQHPTKEEKHMSERAPTPEDLQKLWNDNRPSELPSWRDLTDARKVKARKRLKERPNLSEWRDAIHRIRLSDFCRGWGNTGWRANPDWLLEPDSVTKALEGKYDNPEGRGRKGPVDLSDAEFLQRTAHLKTDANGELILEDEP